VLLPSRLFVQVWLFGSRSAPAGIGWFQNESAAHDNPAVARGSGAGGDGAAGVGVPPPPDPPLPSALPPPLLGGMPEPPPAGGCGAAGAEPLPATMRSVIEDAEAAEPMRFVAVRRTRSVLPSKVRLIRMLLRVAPRIAAQSAPRASQRTQL
jgi:hypothetical protein